MPAHQALYEALTVICFADEDDYIKGLWGVVRALDPVAAERLSKGEGRALWHEMYIEIYGEDPDDLATRVVLLGTSNGEVEGNLTPIPGGSKGTIKGYFSKVPGIVGVTFDAYPEREFGVPSDRLRSLCKGCDEHPCTCTKEVEDGSVGL